MTTYRYAVIFLLSASLVHALTPSLSPISISKLLQRHVGNRCKLSHPFHGMTRTRTNVASAEFFNRDKERNIITNIISNEDPFLWIVLGQPSSGKTALLRNVLSDSCQEGTKKFNFLHLNLRGTDVYSHNSLFRILREAAKRKDRSLWAPFVDTIGKILSLKDHVGQFGGIQLTDRDSFEPNIELQFSSLIDTIPVSDEKPCVFVVDEANELKKLAECDEKVSLIQTILACTRH